MHKIKRAVFPGTFGPIHKGHINIIKRSSKLFDEVIAAVSINIYKDNDKTLNDRFLSTKKAVKSLKLKNVSVEVNEKFTVDFAKKHGCDYIVRCVRDDKDIEYEMTLARANHHLDKNIETILFFADEGLKNISSSTIKMVSDNKQKFKVK